MVGTMPPATSEETALFEAWHTLPPAVLAFASALMSLSHHFVAWAALMPRALIQAITPQPSAMLSHQPRLRNASYASTRPFQL